MSHDQHDGDAQAGETAPPSHEAQPAVDPTAGKTVAEIFGEIVWLMTQDKSCADLRIGDLERLVMPPILLRQFHITYAEVPLGATQNIAKDELSGAVSSKPALQPIKVELFAMVSEVVAAGLDAHPEGAATLNFQDRRSGTSKRLIQIISPFENSIK